MNGGKNMSMEEKELETIDSPAESEEEATPKKKKLLSAKRIEVITAIFLGVTALRTAWATWIGSLHSDAVVSFRSDGLEHHDRLST